MIKIWALLGTGGLTLAAVTFGLLVLSALIERAGPIRLRHWAEEASPGLAGLIEHPVRFEAFRFLLSVIAKLAALLLMGGATLAGAAAGTGWAVGAGLSAAGLTVVLAEGASRLVVGRDPEAALRRFTWPYRILHWALLPLVRLIAGVLPDSVLVRRDDEEEDEASDQEIDAFLQVGTAEGILDEDEQDLVMRVIDFGDSQAKSVMTPRIEMVCGEAGTDLEQLADLFLESKHSRLPLFRESIDEIIGVLHIRELLGALRNGSGESASRLANPPFFVPETKRLDGLLREFQARRQQLAIVVDEFGSTAGLVTVEDLLEEIVGEIVDEHEEIPVSLESVREGTWRIDGRADLGELEELFGVDLEGEPYETVGGLVFGHVGSLPQPGHSFEHRGIGFEVETVVDRRIGAVLVSRDEAETAENGEAD